MRVWVLAAVASLATALPAAAGDYARGHDSVWAQRDIPGDYRCDAYWDRGRDDCDARWRDQRHRVRHHGGGRRHHRAWSYGHGDGYGYGYGYGYGADYRHGGAEAWHGAWGRPDLVYGSGGYAPAGRDPARMAWCRANYRSWDPVTGEYLSYSGRRIFCG